MTTITQKELEAAYTEMSNDEKREIEALEWSESLISDIEPTRD